MAQQKIYLTKEGYEEQLKKHTELKEAERKNIIALQEARSQGDLSENADYDAARNNQAIIAAQLKEVENILNNFKPSVPANVYSRIIYTNTRPKLNLLKNYIKS